MKERDCGRSPTQYCVGWHHLSHDFWQTKKLIAEATLRAELLKEANQNFIFLIDWPQQALAHYQAARKAKGAEQGLDEALKQRLVAYPTDYW